MVDGTTRESLIRSFLLCWVPVLVWAAFIFYLSSQSEPPQPPAVSRLPEWSSIAHFGLYFVLGALLSNAFKGQGARGQGPGTTKDEIPPSPGPPQGIAPSRAYLLAFVVGALYGASDEVHQYFVPRRQTDPLDWMVDVAGVLVGSLVLLLWQMRANKT
jgi:VanZ family protein